MRTFRRATFPCEKLLSWPTRSPGPTRSSSLRNLAGDTIQLNWGDLLITDDLMIIGLGADQLTSQRQW